MSQKNSPSQSTFSQRPRSAKISQDEFNALNTFIQHPSAIGATRRNRSRQQISRDLVLWLRTLKKTRK